MMAFLLRDELLRYGNECDIKEMGRIHYLFKYFNVTHVLQYYILFVVKNIELLYNKVNKHEGRFCMKWCKACDI